MYVWGNLGENSFGSSWREVWFREGSSYQETTVTILVGQGSRLPDCTKFTTGYPPLWFVLSESCKVLKQGAKKVTFKACHSGKLKLEYTSPNVIPTSPKNNFTGRNDLGIPSSSVIWISQKNFSCPLIKLRTKFTSPIAKPTSPGLSDTTFFARWLKSNFSCAMFPWFMP